MDADEIQKALHCELGELGAPDAEHAHPFPRCSAVYSDPGREAYYTPMSHYQPAPFANCWACKMQLTHSICDFRSHEEMMARYEQVLTGSGLGEY